LFPVYAPVLKWLFGLGQPKTSRAAENGHQQIKTTDEQPRQHAKAE